MDPYLWEEEQGKIVMQYSVSVYCFLLLLLFFTWKDFFLCLTSYQLQYMMKQQCVFRVISQFQRNNRISLILKLYNFVKMLLFERKKLVSQFNISESHHSQCNIFFFVVNLLKKVSNLVALECWVHWNIEKFELIEWQRENNINDYETLGKLK